MTSNNRTLALAFGAALALAPFTAEATISRAMNFEDKVENASAIVLGECVRQHSQWDAGKNWILTYSTFRIEKTFKGQPGQEITIVTPGGTVGTIAQDVVGMPRFREGDDHVVFVRNTQAGPTVLYFEQGAYRVVNEGGERMVKPLVSTAVLVDTQRGMAVAPEHPRSLRDFERNVRDTIRQRDAMRMEMMEKQRQADTSFFAQLRQNWPLVALALAGIALATWQLAKRW